MTINEANEIMHDYGDFLAESFAKLNILFAPNIPESFLPYTKDVLEEALNIMAKHYFDQGDKHNVNLIEETIMLLPLFRDDEQSVLQAAKNFDNPKWREALLPTFKEMQDKWMQQKKSNPFKK